MTFEPLPPGMTGLSGGRAWRRGVRRTGAAALWLLAVGAAAWPDPAAAQAQSRARRVQAPAVTPPPAAASASAAKAVPSGWSIAPTPSWVVAGDATIPPTLPAAPVQLALIDRQTRLGDARHVHRYHRAVRQVNGAAGLDGAAQIAVDFDPAYQTLQFHAVDVVRDGVRTTRLAVDKVKLLNRETQLEQRRLDGRMTASLVLDDVRVGDRIDWSYSLVGDNPVFEGRFADIDWTIGSLGPAARYRQRLVVPSTRVLAHRSDGPARVEAATAASPGEREWVVTREGTPQWHHDPTVPASSSLVDLVQFSEFTSWGEVARWAHRQFADAGRADPDVAAQARRLVEGVTDPAERVQRVLDFVQRDVRYFGHEMGVQSHRPAHSAQTLQRRFGDCKDKAALLVAMLGAIDVQAQPVLVSMRLQRDVARLLPSPLAFDHAIVRVKVGDRFVFLDPTRSMQTGSVDEREALDFGHGLVVADEAASTLVAMPSGAGRLRMEVDDEVRVERFAAPARLTTRTTFHGDLAESLRAARAAMPAPEFERELAAEVQRVHPKAEREGAPQWADVPGRNAVEVTTHHTLPDAWSFPEQRRLTMDFALHGLMSPLRLPDQKMRTQPMVLARVGLYRHRLRWVFAEPVFQQPGQSRFDDRTPHYRVQVQASNTAREQTIAGELEVLADRVEAADFARHREQLGRHWPRLGNQIAVAAIPLDGAEAASQALRADAQRWAGDRSLTDVQRMARVRDRLLTQALDGGRLAPRLAAEALVARGMQRDHLARFDDARADFERAVVVAAPTSEALGALAVNALSRGDDAKSIEHADAALALQPGKPEARSTRAKALYMQGRFAEAATELRRLAGEQGGVERSYTALWLALAERRAGGTAPEPQAVDATALWPAPVLRWMLGTATIDEARSAARADAGERRGRECELNFYVGERAAADGDLGAARDGWQRAVDTGVLEFVEHTMAQRRLRSTTAR